MRTNIEIDDELMARAQKLSGLKTKKAVVQEALELLVHINAKKALWDLRGKVEFYEGYDYKEERRNFFRDFDCVESPCEVR